MSPATPCRGRPIGGEDDGRRSTGPAEDRLGGDDALTSGACLVLDANMPTKTRAVRMGLSPPAKMSGSGRTRIVDNDSVVDLETGRGGEFGVRNGADANDDHVGVDLGSSLRMTRSPLEACRSVRPPWFGSAGRHRGCDAFGKMVATSRPRTCCSGISPDTSSVTSSCGSGRGGGLQPDPA